MRVPHARWTSLILFAVAAAALVSPTTDLAEAAGSLTLHTARSGPSHETRDRDVPPTVWFQGFLADASTSEPVNAVYEIIAAIHSLAEGGSPVWGPEVHAGTPIVEGWFNIELGSLVSPLPVFDDPPYYLQLTVNGEELAPRQKLASAPTALRSGVAEEPDDDWTIDGGDVYRSTGNVGIGTSSPSARLDVDGLIRTSAFQLTESPTPGHVLTSDASGVGTWQPAAGNVGGEGGVGYIPRFTGITTIGTSSIYESGGRIGIGTTSTSDATIAVESGVALPILTLTSTAASGPEAINMLRIERTEPMTGIGDAFIKLVAPDASHDGRFIGAYLLHPSGGTLTAFSVESDGYVLSNGGARVFGNDIQWALSAASHYESPDANAVRGDYTGIGYDAVGVHGTADDSDFWGYGGLFEGGYVGAMGSVEPTGDHGYFGLVGKCEGGSGINNGVLASARGSGTNYGVYAEADSGATNWAGWFADDVRVVGNLVTTLGGLEIDHPLDPEGRYLRHAYVASSEMANVYSGNATLDAAGEATVVLPEWFEALNEDLRYQLTPIGRPAPNLHVADPVRDGRFRVAGGEPDMSVSWQVTGIRRDPVAEQNRMAVERDKNPEDRGRYLSPEAYGAPATLGIGHLDTKLKDR